MQFVSVANVSSSISHELHKAAIATAYKKNRFIVFGVFNNAARVAFVSVTNMKEF